MFQKIRELSKHLAIYGSGDVAIQALNFLLLPLYVKYLTKADYGVLALLASVEATVKLFFRWGVDGAFMRFWYDCDDQHARQRLASTLFFFLLGANGILAEPAPYNGPVNSDELKGKAAALPETPGVYFMKDAKGRVLYIGKARVLRDRVASYFHSNPEIEPRLQSMIGQIADFDVLQTATEVDALLAEARLVKDSQPKYNVKLKDDKINRSITLPASILDVAKVQFWCAFVEVVLGEASFAKPLALNTSR